MQTQTSPTLQPGYAETSTRRNPREPQTVIVGTEECANSRYVGTARIHGTWFSAFRSRSGRYYLQVRFGG